MGNIRRLNIFDKRQLRNIANMIAPSSQYHFKYSILKEIAGVVQSFLPLKWKFVSESYVLVDDGKIKGMISVRIQRGNPELINIIRLLFENNDYEVGKELINFVIAHYGARGAKTFKVVIENSQKELEHLFTSGCGFRCGSWENLWDITHDIGYFLKQKSEDFERVNDFHAKKLGEFYNSELVSIYRPALEHAENEYKEPVLRMFDTRYYKNYVLMLEDFVVACLNIQSKDNNNFIITLTKVDGYKLDYDRLIAFALKEISVSKSQNFHAYLKQQKSLKFSADFENYLHARNYECVQTQHVLVKDFYRPIKQTFQAFVFGENKVLSN